MSLLWFVVILKLNLIYFKFSSVKKRFFLAVALTERSRINLSFFLLQRKKILNVERKKSNKNNIENTKKVN